MFSKLAPIGCQLPADGVNKMRRLLFPFRNQIIVTNKTLATFTLSFCTPIRSHLDCIFLTFPISFSFSRFFFWFFSLLSFSSSKWKSCFKWRKPKRMKKWSSYPPFAPKQPVLGMCSRNLIDVRKNILLGFKSWSKNKTFHRLCTCLTIWTNPKRART